VSHYRLALAVATLVGLFALPFATPLTPVAAQTAPEPTTTAPGSSPGPSTGVYPETGFRLADEKFALYFQARGGVATFGYPTSRRLFLLGTPVQFFQRHVMQLQGDGRVTLLNLLSEVVSFSGVVDAIPPLRFLDGLGRRM